MTEQLTSSTLRALAVPETEVDGVYVVSLGALMAHADAWQRLERRVESAKGLIRILRNIAINGTPLREQANEWLAGDAAQEDSDD